MPLLANHGGNATMKNKVLYSIIALLTIVLASQSETVTGFFATDPVEAKDRFQTEAVKPVPVRKPVAIMEVKSPSSLAVAITGNKCSTGWVSIRLMPTMSKHSDSFLLGR